MTGFAVTTEQRTVIETMIANGRKMLAPQPGDDVPKGAAILEMLAGFLAQQQSEIPARLRSKVYLDAVDDKPAWAVKEACDRVIHNRADINNAYGPTPPQLVEVTDDVLVPLRRDLLDLERLLEAARTADQPILSAYAAPWSRTWWALFYGYVEANLGAFKDRRSEPSQKIAHIISLAISRVGWKAEPEVLAAAEERGKNFLPVMVGTPECDGWQKHFAELHVNMPLPVAAPVWMPDKLPPEMRKLDATAREAAKEAETAK
jgi:hypothetical protein